MKLRDAAEVTLSIMGVYSIVHAVLDIPTLVYISYMWLANIHDAEKVITIFPALLGNFGTFAANLVVGILLVLLASRIANWIARRCASAATSDVDLRIVSREGFRFCLKIIGITVLIAGVALLVQWDWGHAIAGAITLALAMYLILGGGWLTRFAWGKADAQ